MTRRRFYIFFIIVGFALFIIALLFTSCDKKATISNDNNNSKIIEDIYGRQINVPNDVTKIATVGSAARITTYAGCNDKLVAVTEMEKEDILRPYTIAWADTFKQLPATSNGNHINNTTVDKEKMLSLKPDVIFSSRVASECDQLQNDLNIPVVGISFHDEIFSDNVYRSIKICGEVANTQKHAEEVIEYIKGLKSDLDKHCNNTNKKIYKGAVNFKGSKDLCGTISNYCVYAAIKQKNVADKENIDSAYDTNLEQIYNWNPDYIFMDCTNSSKIETQIDKNKHMFDNINAYKNHNMYYVAPFNFNGTNLEYGLCEAYYTASIINENAFEDYNLEEKFDEIFYMLDGKKIFSQLKELGIKFEKANF